MVLSAGDTLYFDGVLDGGTFVDPGDTGRNAGDTDVVYSIAALTRVGEPFQKLDAAPSPSPKT